ncbi:MAG: ThiF family adenylyltransferase [Oricola sp.]|nr:MAG: ThiF family adenylyltransferase [Oricola sp.]
MSLPTRLAISGIHHAALVAHLFPGDGLEAAAVALCGNLAGSAPKLCVKDLILIPHEKCDRAVDAVSWPTDLLDEALRRAKADGLSVLLIHSHPRGFWEFSEKDDESDADVVPDIFDELEGKDVHVGTSIMIADGAMKVRIYDQKMQPTVLDRVLVAGDDIRVIRSERRTAPMAFGKDMTAQLEDLHACIVGVSGTGSVVAEQTGRLGFGRVTLIDPDHIESKNLNRILNSTAADAEAERMKPVRFREAILSYRPNADVRAISQSIEEREAVLAAADADVLFCCVDTATGRQMCDLIANTFVIPLIDVGVTIPTAKKEDVREIADVVGRVDYIQPGGSTLYDRSVYTQRALRAEELARTDPDGHAEELADGYIDGAPDEEPSVISLNMRAAAAAVNEFIARAFPYRFEPNRHYGRTEFSLAEMSESYFSEDTWTANNCLSLLGRGGKEPLLGIPSLGPRTFRGAA